MSTDTSHAVLALGGDLDLEDIESAGADGATGPAGATGAVGATGAAGAVGATGAAGAGLFDSEVRTADLTLTGSLQTIVDLGAGVTGHTYFIRGLIRISGLANATNLSLSIVGNASSNFAFEASMMEAGGAGERIISADSGQASITMVVPFETGGGAPACIRFEGTYQAGGTGNILVRMSEDAGSSDAVTHAVVEFFDADA